jgi:hypothetical protein
VLASAGVSNFQLLPRQYAWLGLRVIGAGPATSLVATEAVKNSVSSMSLFRRARRMRRLFRGTPDDSRPPLSTFLVPRGTETGNSSHFGNCGRLRALVASSSPLYIAGPAGIFMRNLEGRL